MPTTEELWHLKSSINITILIIVEYQLSGISSFETIIIIYFNLLMEMENQVSISIPSWHRVYPKLLHEEHLVGVLLGGP